MLVETADYPVQNMRKNKSEVFESRHSGVFNFSQLIIIRRSLNCTQFSMSMETMGATKKCAHKCAN